ARGGGGPDRRGRRETAAASIRLAGPLSRRFHGLFVRSLPFNQTKRSDSNEESKEGVRGGDCPWGARRRRLSIGAGWLEPAELPASGGQLAGWLAGVGD